MACWVEDEIRENMKVEAAMGKGFGDEQPLTRLGPF